MKRTLYIALGAAATLLVDFPAALAQSATTDKSISTRTVVKRTADGKSDTLSKSIDTGFVNPCNAVERPSWCKERE